jgi:hypothetical protein
MTQEQPLTPDQILATQVDVILRVTVDVAEWQRLYNLDSPASARLLVRYTAAEVVQNHFRNYLGLKDVVVKAVSITGKEL